MCKICSKLTIKIPERRHSDPVIVSFKQISHIFYGISIVEFEQVKVDWASYYYYIIKFYSEEYHHQLTSKDFWKFSNYPRNSYIFNDRNSNTTILVWNCIVF